MDGVDRFEHGGMGVAGMRARMLSVGGELNLDLLGPGLAVVARVPFQRAVAGRAVAGVASEDAAALSWRRRRRVSRRA